LFEARSAITQDKTTTTITTVLQQQQRHINREGQRARVVGVKKKLEKSSPETVKNPARPT
jgi:uncharacterized coiled-coil protein SlyX